MLFYLFYWANFYGITLGDVAGYGRFTKHLTQKKLSGLLTQREKKKKKLVHCC